MAEVRCGEVPVTVRATSNVSDEDGWDCLLVVDGHEGVPATIRQSLVSRRTVDKAADNELCVLECSAAPGGRVVYSPVGPLGDYDDVRSYGEAAGRAVSRAIKAGSKSPLLVLPSSNKFQNSELVTLLGALEELYVPLQLREDVPSKRTKLTVLGAYTESKRVKLDEVITLANILESGRFVARDIGGGDPERMAPPRVEEYVRELFKDTDISVSTVSDLNQIEKEYPLFEAVNRAASVIPRHQGRIVFLEYKPPGGSNIEKSLFLVGKGVTYDTGGADVKAGGIMAGMSRDKCGAAAVAGFMQVCNLLRPKGVRVVGALAVVRNSIGENCYVSDEVITSRAGRRVLVGNTDAEGRMAMADVLCKLKEDALNSPNSHLMTIATLTGHACLAAGDGNSIVIDNALARKEAHGSKLQSSGEAIGNPFEVSVLRREDFKFHKGKGQGHDILQCNNLPSSRTPRGHQTPAAFLMMASGLEEAALKYSHLDIAASGGDVPNEPTGAPILALAQLHLLQ